MGVVELILSAALISFLLIRYNMIDIIMHVVKEIVEYYPYLNYRNDIHLRGKYKDSKLVAVIP